MSRMTSPSATALICALVSGAFAACEGASSAQAPAGTVTWRSDGSGSIEPPAADAACVGYRAPVSRGRLPAAVAESSGLCDSAFDSNRLWTHNDAGGTPNLFAVSRTGELRSTVTLEGADPDDWEDIARGPCGPTDADRRCLYVSNTGNNGLDRNTVEIFRVIEPDTLQPTMTIRRLETMKVRYPTGALDCEAMLVDDSGRVVLFSKEEGRTRIFVAPYSTVGTVDLTLVAEGTLADPSTDEPEKVTAADYDALRRTLAFRTYRNGYEVRLPEGLQVESIARLPVQRIALADEAQGEALAYVGDGLVSTSEGTGARLTYYDCIAE